MFIQLKTSDGNHFVCAENGGGSGVSASRRWAAEWETFRVAPRSGSTVRTGQPVNLVTSDGMHYLCAENGGGREVVANRTVPLQWETFVLERDDGGADVVDGCALHLRAYNGQYVCAENGGGGAVNANRDVAAQWETFTVRVIPRELTFPMRVNGQARLSTGKWVSADSTLARDGRLHTELHVWTRNEWYGFHGACAVVAVDQANTMLWRTDLHTLGVDGTWIPGKPSSRTAQYDETVPGDVLQKLTAIRLLLVENPRNMLGEDLDIAIEAGKKIVEIGKVVTAIFALF